MKRSIVLAVMCFVLLAAGPSHPVELTTEIGSVAGFTGKVGVVQTMTIDKKSITHKTILESHGNFDYRHVDIPTDRLPAVEKGIADCLVDSDKDQEKDVGGFKVSCSAINGKRVIEVEEIPAEFLSRHSVLVDPDNAQVLLVLLKKAEGVRDWMNERAPALQK